MKKLFIVFYIVGMLGFTISGAIAGLIILSDESIWKYGVVGIFIFGGIWGFSVWIGLKNGWLEQRVKLMNIYVKTQK